jgi:glycosidase
MKQIKLKHTVLFIILSIISIPVFSQLIVTDPAFPIENQAVTITYDASLGNGTLAGHTGDIYAHTGVITDQSSSGSDWKYVIAEWSQNMPEALLTSVGTDLYELEITPSIRDFYGVPQGEEILQMAFVFRTEDGSIVGREADGGDIFVDVYEEELNVNIVNPSQDATILELNETIDVEVEAMLATTITLYVDNIQVAQETGNELSHTVTADVDGKHWIKAVATDGTESVADSVYYYVLEEVVVEELPSGVTDGINYIDQNTVTLVLYAPFKEYVFAIGDYSNWEVDSDNFMKQTPDGNRYWITFDNLTIGQEYIFQYFIDGELKIADPYADKISDPWNDKWISDDVYPNLIEYPDGETTEIASVFQTDQTEYNWQITNFEAPAVEDLVIYELHFRDFTIEGEVGYIQSAMEKLDYLEELGVNAIELMPINEFEGNDSWGYNPAFYFATDKAYGTKDDYKEFIDECHSRGIAVIIDMVLNHSYGQSPLVRMYFDPEAGEWGQPTAENPWYNEECPHNPWCWGYDFNHESQLTKDFIDRVNSYWLTEYKVDGFRFDFTKGFTNTIGDGWQYDASRIANLKRMSDEIWDVNENTYVILEHLTDNSEETELANYGCLLWGNMNHEYCEASMGYDSDLTWASYQDRGWDNPNLIAYMESHDEERIMFKNYTFGNSNGAYNTKSTGIGLRRLDMIATLFFTIPGPKMIWQFGEIGYDVSIDDPCRVCMKPVRWEYAEENWRLQTYQTYQALIDLKKNYEAFQSTDFTLNEADFLKRISINHASMDVRVIANCDVVAGTVSPVFSESGNWYEFFTGETLNVTDPNMEISLQPGEFRIYTTEELPTPNIISRIDDEIINNGNGISIFPNPNNGTFNISLSNITNKINKVEIINNVGAVISQTNEISTTLFEVNISNQPKGLYFVKVHTNSEIIIEKIILCE